MVDVVIVAVCFAMTVQAGESPAGDGRVRGLIRDLGADYLVVRERAFSELEKAGSAAEPHLLKALRDADHRKRRACITLLLKLGSEAALDPVARLYREDPDVSVREEAFAFMCGAGKKAESHLIQALDGRRSDHRLRAVKALQEMESRACARQMAGLYDREQDPVLKKAAFECLQSVGEAAEPFLLSLLKSADPAVRLGALKGLKRTEERKVLDEIGALFVQETDDSALAQAYLLLEKAGAEAEPHFLSGLKSSEVPIRLRSLEGLSALKAGSLLKAAPGLYLEDPSEEVRVKAAELLKARGMEAEDAFLRGLDSDVPGVRLAAIGALGEMGSAAPLDRIARLFRESEEPELHRATFDYLKSQAAAAEEDLLRALGDEDKGIRREAMGALGKVGAKAAIPALVDYLADLDPDMKKAARDALVLIGDPAVAPIRDAVREGRIREREEEEFLFAHNQDKVERLLGKLLTEEGVSGYYPGMFRGIDAFGRERALPVLIRIVRDPAYMFRPGTPRSSVQQYELRMKELAILALGEFGDERGVEPLQEAYAAVSSIPGDDLAEELVVALHRLGKREPYEDFAGRIRGRAAEAFENHSGPEACRALFTLALVQKRVGDRKGARTTNLDLLAEVKKRQIARSEVEVLSSTYYNLACLAALDGEKEKGVDWLRQAVEAGFVSRAWIRQDRDLEGLRDLPSYRALMARDDLFRPAEDR